MGWNQGYTVFEKAVIDSYDSSKLDKTLLSTLMEPYRGTDIDSGGSHDLKTKDGKDVMQVVIEVWGLEMPAEPEGTYDDNPDPWEDYYDIKCDLFSRVTGHFGWC